MKKIFLLCFLVSLATASCFSQVPTSAISSGNSLARDTVTNTAAKTWFMPTAVKFSGEQKLVSLQVDITRISGTAGGTVVPLASLDGVTFGVIGSGSFTPTDVASQTAVFVVPTGFLYYGFRYTGTGTMSCSAVGKVLRK